MKPAGAELKILTVDEAIAYLKEDSPANEKIMLLTKCAQSFLRMNEQGVVYELSVDPQQSVEAHMVSVHV